MIFAVFALFAVFAVAVVFRLNSVNGDGDGENDRKERFHGTKVFVAARSRAFTQWWCESLLPIP
jgi:hypothetical protein